MNCALPRIGVEGVAFWSPQLTSWDFARALMRGERQAAPLGAPRPAPTLLAPTERRRAPDTVAVALEVALRASAEARRVPAQLPAVFASTYGELSINDYMCATLASTPALVSPIKFHNSVHNAAAGYWSIGTASHAPYTAISASQYTFAVGLLEAITQAACGSQPVLYVAFDGEATGPLATVASSRGLLGVALVMAPFDEQRARHSLDVTVVTGATVRASVACTSAAALVCDNALAPCVPFFEALAAVQSNGITLALGHQAALHVQVR